MNTSLYITVPYFTAFRHTDTSLYIAVPYLTSLHLAIRTLHCTLLYLTSLHFAIRTLRCTLLYLTLLHCISPYEHFAVHCCTLLYFTAFRHTDTSLYMYLTYECIIASTACINRTAPLFRFGFEAFTALFSS